MLICSVDDEIDLRLLQRQHADAIEGLSPGDLSFAQGEWGEWTALPGGAAEWLAVALVEFGRGTRLEAGILEGPHYWAWWLCTTSTANGDRRPSITAWIAGTAA